MNNKKVDLNNLDNTGKILVAEKKIIDSYLKNKSKVLNKNGEDVVAKQLAPISFAFTTVIQYLDSRVKDLEEQIKKEEE